MASSMGESLNKSVSQCEPNSVVSGLSLDTELRMSRSLLKDQIRQNKILEEQNLELSNRCVILDNKCNELFARTRIYDKDTPKGNRLISDEEKLESDMLKAKIDSSILKSIVTPLETEVAFLKKRLAESEACLSMSSFKPLTILPEVSIDTLSINGDDSSNENIKYPLTSRDSQISMRYDADLQQKLDARDLYVVAMCKKIYELESQYTAIKIENSDLKLKLEREEAAHQDLKETWQKANEQFILQSLNFQNEIQHLKTTSTIPSSPNNNTTRHRSQAEPTINLHSTPNESILLQAEVSRLNQEVLAEKGKTKESEIIFKAFESEINEKVNKIEIDITSMDSLLIGIQEELIRRTANSAFKD